MVKLAAGVNRRAALNPHLPVAERKLAARSRLSGQVAQGLSQALRNVRIIKVVPTVIRLDGLRVVVYPNDHRPAHVHVIGRGSEAVFYLNCPDGPVELRENYGFRSREFGHIGDLLTAKLVEVCRAWEHIHGIA